MNNSRLTGNDAMNIIFLLILVCVFEELPSGRYPNSEVAAAVNGASRRTVHQPQGKDKPEEGAGDRSAYFLKNHGRGDESSSPPLVSQNTESVSQSEAIAWRAKLCVPAPFYLFFLSLMRAAEELFGKVSVMSIKNV